MNIAVKYSTNEEVRPALSRVRSEAFDEKRNKIISCAARLFGRNGFDGTSIQQIAPEVHLAKGSLYYYFGSKDEILYEVISHGMQEILPLARYVFSSDLSPKEKLRQLIRNHIIHVIECHDHVVVGIRERDKLLPEFRKKYVGLRDEYQNLWVSVLEQGVQLGEFQQINVRLTAYAVFDMCNNITNWFKPEGAYSLEYVADYYAELVCDRMLRNNPGLGAGKTSVHRGGSGDL